MEKRIDVDAYFRRPETNRPQELVFGMAREPPAPFYGHQQAVGQLFLVLRTHVHERQLGDVCLAPMDVVLDEESGLVVQPDLMFISHERRDIIRNHVWGAPDLVVEVVSPATQHRDRTLKLAWYRKYGVRECWLVDAAERRIEVVDCESDQLESFTGDTPIRSRVLPHLAAPSSACFQTTPA
jgi:Uma2 family endonuclease